LPQTTVAAFYNNFGTGAPGYSRSFAAYFPSIAYDNVPGSQTPGRYWVAWAESYDHLDDILNFPPAATGPAIAEVENNGTQNKATAFTPGVILRGSSATTSDVDYFSCPLSAGDNVIVWVDSIGPSQLYELDVRGPLDEKLAH